jgi:OHCU decarboxylase
LGEQEFIGTYGGAYERSPWFALDAWVREPHESLDTLDGLAGAMRRSVERADGKAKMQLLRTHPQLLARANLTRESVSEQAAAGLNNCSIDEAEEFRQLNTDYVARFSFPFIKAVRGFTRQEILAEFRKRIANDPHTEFATALDEVHKIARLRLEDLT